MVRLGELTGTARRSGDSSGHATLVLKRHVEGMPQADVELVPQQEGQESRSSDVPDSKPQFSEWSSHGGLMETHIWLAVSSAARQPRKHYICCPG